MGELVASALAQEGVSRVSSYVSTKIDDKASKAEIIARIEMALSRLAFALERTGKTPITYVSLLRRWKILKDAYIEGTYLLNKHKPGLLEGDEETGRAVVRRFFYLQWIASSIANMSISSLLGLNNEQHLSSSVARKFEWYADCADKFVADVESVCPLRCDTFFRCAFTRQLLEGKRLRYTRTKGSQELWLGIYPVISEGRGIVASLSYKYFNPEKLDKSVDLWMMLRISESTDIIGIASNCLRSSASLLNLVAEDAMGALTLLSNLQEISSSYDPHLVDQKITASFALFVRPDPICCDANVHKPGVDQDIISSELTHIFPEQVIHFRLTCYMPAAEQQAGRIRNIMMIDRSPHLCLTLSFDPHYPLGSTREECYISRYVGCKATKRSPYGSIQQTICTVRSEAIDCLIHQPEMTNYGVNWYTNHGCASFNVKKASTGDMATVSEVSGSYNTWSGGKRKR